jgi:LAS superfamily LD-carboxypeptidase LdcB
MGKTNFSLAVFFLGIFLSYPIHAELDVQRLSEQDIQRVKTILAKLTPVIQQRETAGTLATLSFEELYAPLVKEEISFLQQFQKLDPVKVGIKTTWHGIANGNVALVRVDSQAIKKNGEVTYLSIQYVPREVYEQYVKMMEAMKKDLGKQLYIESAYRSSAYQLYLFILYLKNHDYSILETARWNALPGYSEHGDPEHQALDFINEEGINGEENPESFEKLPEYQWLLKHAHEHHFVLSFPKNDPSGIAFEPWHWRYEKED